MRFWFFTTVHISWHISCFSCGFLLGVAGAPYTFPWLWLHVTAVLTVLAVMVVLLFKTRIRLVLMLAVLAGSLCGLYWGGSERAGFLAYKPYLGKSVILQGMVAEDISVSKKGDSRMLTKQVRLNERPMRGEVWLSTRKAAGIKRGDIVAVQGVIREGFGALPASMPRADVISNYRPYPGDVAGRIRDRFTSAIQTAIPSPEALLGIGYLTGQRSTLPESLDEQLRIVGLTHAVVASGYNLTILVGFARRAFLKLSKYLSAISGAAMTGAFILITGLSPSMSRAGLVTGLSLAAWYYGRTLHPLVLLPVAAVITLVVDPSFIWGDFGWYLSFLAFVGVIILAPLLRAYLWGPAEPPAVLQLLVDTISAQLVTLPVILFGFGQYASYALLANVLVLPLVPLAMLFTFLGGILTLIIPYYDQFWGMPAYVVLHYMLEVVRKIAYLPGAQHEFHLGLAGLVASYVVLWGLILALQRVTRYSFRQKNEYLK